MNNETVITLCSFNLKYASSDRFLSDTLEQTFFLVPLKLTEVYCIFLHPSSKLFQSMRASLYKPLAVCGLLITHCFTVFLTFFITYFMKVFLLNLNCACIVIQD